MLKVTGAFCVALGLVAGFVLVASPFGVLPFARSSLSAWVLFPTSFVAGSMLLALAAPGMALGRLWHFCSAALLGSPAPPRSVSCCRCSASCSRLMRRCRYGTS